MLKAHSAGSSGIKTRQGEPPSHPNTPNFLLNCASPDLFVSITEDMHGFTHECGTTLPDPVVVDGKARVFYPHICQVSHENHITSVEVLVDVGMVLADGCLNIGIIRTGMRVFTYHANGDLSTFDLDGFLLLPGVAGPFLL
jgi:hypothetical protein